MKGLEIIRSWREQEGWVILSLCFLLADAARMAYQGQGSAPSPAIRFLTYVVLYYGFFCWVNWDRKRSKVPMTFDYGLYFYLLLPFFVLVYLVRSRGPAMVAMTFLVMLGIYIASAVVALPVYLLSLQHR